MTHTEPQLQAILAGIERACTRAGRDPAEVRLIAVSKTFGAEAVRELYEAGQRDFGENYAQELRDKAAALEELDALRWHFIGPVQTNKVRYLVGRVVMLHAVDRLEVARAVSDRVQRTGAPVLPVLLAVNVAGEESKSGVPPEALPSLYRAVGDLPGVRVEGLFCLPPWADDPETSRPWFRRMRELRDALHREEGSGALPHLSMGMSHDYEVAIEEGATLVRVGTALFGARERKT